MKRLNKETEKPFKQGDTREDGFRFDGYVTTVKRSTGFFKEMWRSPEGYKRRIARKAYNKKVMCQKVTNVIDKIKIGDLSFLDDIPEKTRIEVEKIGILTYNGCTICGHDNPKHLDFHHRVKTLKDKDIGSFFRTSFWQFLKAYQEMLKCDVYCAHHHRDIERSMKNRSTIKEIKYENGTITEIRKTA